MGRKGIFDGTHGWTDGWMDKLNGLGGYCIRWRTNDVEKGSLNHHGSAYTARSPGY
jgi:hypothetical protein